jgi:hypothetical protein
VRARLLDQGSAAIILVEAMREVYGVSLAAWCELCHTTWCQTAGQLPRWPSCMRLKATNTADENVYKITKSRPKSRQGLRISDHPPTAMTHTVTSRDSDVWGNEDACPRKQPYG